MAALTHTSENCYPEQRPQEGDPDLMNIDGGSGGDHWKPDVVARSATILAVTAPDSLIFPAIVSLAAEDKVSNVVDVTASIGAGTVDSSVGLVFGSWPVTGPSMTRRTCCPPERSPAADEQPEHSEDTTEHPYQKRVHTSADDGAYYCVSSRRRLTLLAIFHVRSDQLTRTPDTTLEFRCS
jgi:hypothetical protein